MHKNFIIKQLKHIERKSFIMDLESYKVNCLFFYKSCQTSMMVNEILFEQNKYSFFLRKKNSLKNIFIHEKKKMTQSLGLAIILSNS